MLFSIRFLVPCRRWSVFSDFRHQLSLTSVRVASTSSNPVMEALPPPPDDTKAAAAEMAAATAVASGNRVKTGGNLECLTS